MKNLRISFLFLLITFAWQIALADEQDHKNSVTIQVGVNGNTQDAKYHLLIFPPDLSYSRELLRVKGFNLATSTFYDNIGVKVSDTNFAYRVGQKFDLSFAAGNYIPYATLGLGLIRNGHKYQTTPVYGGGLLYRLSEKLFFINELNFQKVDYQGSNYTIVNFATGLTYAF